MVYAWFMEQFIEQYRVEASSIAYSIYREVYRPVHIVHLDHMMVHSCTNTDSYQLYAGYCGPVADSQRNLKSIICGTSVLNMIRM